MIRLSIWIIIFFIAILLSIDFLFLILVTHILLVLQSLASIFWRRLKLASCLTIKHSLLINIRTHLLRISLACLLLSVRTIDINLYAFYVLINFINVKFVIVNLFIYFLAIWVSALNLFLTHQFLICSPTAFNFPRSDPINFLLITYRDQIWSLRLRCLLIWLLKLFCLGFRYRRPLLGSSALASDARLVYRILLVRWLLVSATFFLRLSRFLLNSSILTLGTWPLLSRLLTLTRSVLSLSLAWLCSSHRSPTCHCTGFSLEIWLVDSLLFHSRCWLIHWYLALMVICCISLSCGFSSRLRNRGCLRAFLEVVLVRAYWLCCSKTLRSYLSLC